MEITPLMGWGYASGVQCVLSMCAVPNSVPSTTERRRISWKEKLSAGTPALTYPSPPCCADHTCARSTRSFRKLSPGRQTSFIIGGLSPRSLVLPSCRDPPPAAAHLGIHCNKAPSTAKSSNYKNQKGIKMSIPHSLAFEHL